MLELEWKHKCDKMPYSACSIIKFKESDCSRVTFKYYSREDVSFETVLYGFEFCPYCGVKLGDEE